MNHLVEPSSTSPASVSGILIDAYAHLLLSASSEKGNFLELARHAPMHGLLTALRAVLHIDNQVRDDSETGVHRVTHTNGRKLPLN